jgi:hypothetical protein
VGIVALTLPGTWHYRFENTPIPKTAYESTFYVSKRLVPPLEQP